MIDAGRDFRLGIRGNELTRHGVYAASLYYDTFQRSAAVKFKHPVFLSIFVLN